jgi:hypothetical protein
MNVSIFSQMAYENKHNWTLGQNKPNSKPIQTQTNPICRMPKMSVNSILTKDYERNDIFAIPENKPNSNPIKPNFTYPQRGKTEVRCRFSEVRYLSSAFCFCRKASCVLASVHGPHDRNRLRLQWHFRLQKTSHKQDFVFRLGASFTVFRNCLAFRVLRTGPGRIRTYDQWIMSPLL